MKRIKNELCQLRSQAPRIKISGRSPADIRGMPLVQFLGENLFVKVTHRTLGGSIAMSSSLCWESVEVDCADTEGIGVPLPSVENGMVHVIPYSTRDMECHSLSLSACIAGVILGGGMNYAEALLHRFGILGADGGPGEGLSNGLEKLSAGSLSKLFKASPLIPDDLHENMKSWCGRFADLKAPCTNACPTGWITSRRAQRGC
ncbi:hypothetical protein Vadar_024384 [Vaccinium darrowii]|uniref:Uncharacterized protein n=1 Tax=Vaccinium darrowii TaxID=229202 RepID=A0ACB7Z692_9ERIC|nr:hypothetical protein Vadar_024384 [Vaccinium darrowii]